MNYKHYAFSNEVKSDLAEFHKVASKKKQVNPRKYLWKLLLPKNELLTDELNKMVCASKSSSIIDLTDNINLSPDKLTNKQMEVSYTVDLTCDNIKSSQNTNLTNNNEESKLIANESTVNDLVESLKESLEFDILNNNVMKYLINLDEDQLGQIFVTLLENLDTESICRLGNSIVKSNCLEHSTIVEYFNKHILIPKLISEYNIHIHSLFVSFLNNFSNITCQEFANKFQETTECTKCIQENLTSLNNTQKQKLLRNFVMSSTKLEKHHFPIVDSLLSNEIDIESIQRLIELLGIISNIFSNDKIFGKLILNIITNSKNKISLFEQQLTHIISLHRSVWKNKLSKALTECLANNLSMSQSLRY